MNIVNTKSERISARPQASALAEINLEQLLGLSLNRISTWVRRKILEAQLRSLHRIAEYFAWQQENGTVGLADVHKRIAMAKSDLHRLQKP